MLTWLRLYNSPERVTSSRVGIPGLFFLSPSPHFFFFLFYWKGGVTGLGGGGAVIVEHLSGSQLQRRGRPVIYSNICKMQSPLYMLLIMQRARVGLESEQSCSDGVLRSPCLGFTLMATGVNMLYGRGISAAQCFQAQVSPGWYFAPNASRL